MNFDEAIETHGKWKLALLKYLENGGGQLDADIVGSDSHCSLGKWIYGEGAQYRALPLFATLVSSHARFHKCAALLVVKIDAGAYVPKSDIMSASSPFGMTSFNLINALRQMKSRFGSTSRKAF